MRVLHLYDTMDRPETLLARGLSEQEGLMIDVMCNQSDGYHYFLDDAPCTKDVLVCGNRLDWAAIFKVRSKLRSVSYDIIHAFTARTLSVSLIASLGIKPSPKIIAYRGAIGNVKRSDPSSWLTYLNPRVSKINCVSRAVEKDLKKSGVSPQKLLTIYKGHDVSWYEGSERVDLEQFGVPKDAFVIGCVANMRRTKGVDVLLEAAALLPEECPFHYLLVGTVRDERLFELAKNERIAGRVHFTGWREDASVLAGMPDIFVMPSRDREGLPKGVIEAMIKRIPSIVTNVGGMPELIKNGEEGFVIPKDDIEALVGAIEKLWNSPELRRQFGEAARKKIEESFSAAKTLEQTLLLYQSFC